MQKNGIGLLKSTIQNKKKDYKILKLLLKPGRGTHAVPALERQRLEDQEFKISLATQRARG